MDDLFAWWTNYCELPEDASSPTLIKINLEWR